MTISVRALRGSLLLLALAGGCRSDPALTGSWVTHAPGEPALLSFRADGTGHRVAGERVENFHYSVDYRRDPVTVDLDFEGRTGETGVVPGIARFDGNGIMELKLGSPGGERPPCFSPESRGVVYKRPPSR
jgi:hypothetical protein